MQPGKWVPTLRIRNFITAAQAEQTALLPNGRCCCSASGIAVAVAGAAGQNEWAATIFWGELRSRCAPLCVRQPGQAMHRIHFALKWLFREQLAEIIVATCASSLAGVTGRQGAEQ